MEVVNRFALVVRPKRRYLEWANGLAHGEAPLTLEALPGLTQIVLVEATSEEPDREELIELYAEDIWDQQLEAWWTNEADWPANRTPHTLRDWFEITVVDLVVDADPEAAWGEGDLDVDEDDGLDEPDAMANQCVWCDKEIDEDAEVYSLFMTLRPDDPLRDGSRTAVLVPVAGRDRLAVVAQPGSDMAREGHDLSFALCSERCAQAMKEALERERGAQLS